jgi:hypothetical protein
MSVERFREICKDAYDFDEALKRQNLKKESVELLRLKLKSVKIAPKFLVDNQVSEKAEMNFMNSNVFLEASVVLELMQR